MSGKASVVQYKASLRRAIRRNAAEPEVNFLNITAMLDIMTIILVFLLKSLGESSASVPQSDDLRLPRSIIKTDPASEGVVITLSKSQILVGDDRVLSLPPRDAQVQTGAGPSHKPSPTDLFITPLGSALTNARRLDKAVQQAKGKPSPHSKAIIIADATTPFRLLAEVLYTAGQSEFGEFNLTVVQSKAIAE